MSLAQAATAERATATAAAAGLRHVAAVASGEAAGAASGVHTIRHAKSRKHRELQDTVDFRRGSWTVSHFKQRRSGSRSGSHSGGGLRRLIHASLLRHGEAE